MKQVPCHAPKIPEWLDFLNVWVRETRFSQYAANGLGVSRSQLTGLSNSLRRREVTSDASGETTETAASFDTQSGILVETSTTGAQTPAVRKKRHGRDVEIHDATGLYYLKRDPFGRPSMRRFDNGAFSGGYPLDAAIFNDCGDRVLSAVCEYNSATFLVKSFDYDVFGSAPSEARRFLRGASPRRASTSHPLVPSVGTMEEESNPNEVV